MKIYSKITKELFECISFESPFSIFRKQKGAVEITRIKNYCYVFPQKNYVFGYNAKRNHAYKEETIYCVLIWQIKISHVRKAS